MNFFPAMGEGIRLRADVAVPMPRRGRGADARRLAHSVLE